MRHLINRSRLMRVVHARARASRSR